jgi:hypothetical protein
MNISLSVRIRRLAPRSHLPPEEQNHPDQEGGAHNQRRSQCRQILEHADLLSRPSSLAHSPLGIVTHPPARPAPAPTLSSSAGTPAVPDKPGAPRNRSRAGRTPAESLSGNRHRRPGRDRPRARADQAPLPRAGPAAGPEREEAPLPRVGPGAGPERAKAPLPRAGAGVACPTAPPTRAPRARPGNLSRTGASPRSPGQRRQDSNRRNGQTGPPALPPRAQHQGTIPRPGPAPAEPWATAPAQKRRPLRRVPSPHVGPP